MSRIKASTHPRRIQSPRHNFFFSPSFDIRTRAMSQTVVLKVGMSCEGCAGAVRRVLGKMEGVESYNIDMKEQKVTVIGNVQPDAVLQTVSKTGKKTAFWEVEAPAAPEVKSGEAPAESETKNPVETVATA